MISIRNVVFIVNTVLLCVLIVFNVYFVNGETSFVDTKEYEYGSDIFFEITHPPELQYTYRIRPAKSFGIPFDKERFPSKKTKLVLVDPTHGCEMPTNAKQLKGNVAFVKRGSRCSFLKKTIISELSGAKAIVITDNNIYDDTAYVHMIDDNSEMSANIPAGFLVGKSGHLIHSKMSELMVTELPIVFPLNMTYVPLHKINQPPWISI